MGITTPSLDELRSQARRTFRTWPIYLMLRLRDVEQHLTPAQRVELGPVLGFGAPNPMVPLPEAIARDGRLTLLIEYGLLPEQDEWSEPLPMLAERPPITTCRFEIETQTSGVSLMCEAQHEADLLRLELLCTEAAYNHDLKMAATLFMSIQTDVSSDAALEAARLWAVLHGGRQLAWETVKTRDADTNGPAMPAAALPPRRRGRGLFRSPN
jgi:hypothetical protein